METKKQKIARLEKELEKANKHIEALTDKIEQYEDAQDNIPEGCTPGRWCDTCAFRDYVTVLTYDGSLFTPFAAHRTSRLRICAKNRCANFVREVHDADKSDS